MKKQLILLFTSLYLLFFLVSCTKVDTLEKSSLTISQNKVTLPDTKISEQNAGQAVVADIKKPTIYDIVGNSNKQSKKENASMLNWRSKIKQFALENPGIIFLNGQTDEKIVCLSFDDGPDNINTPKILNILKEENIKGSFFFIGNKLDKYKNIVKRTFLEGNLVLNHSWSHPELAKKNESIIKKEIASTEDKIFEITGKKPALIRPPYGSVDKKVVESLKNDSYKYVIWSIDTMDWSQREKENMSKNVIENVRPGDIVLMHSNEDKKVTVEALPLIIHGLRAKGYHFVDLGELLGVNPYKD